MSKGLLVCYRRAPGIINMGALADILSDKLIPDNIVPNTPKVSTSNKLALAVLNPTDAIPSFQTSACVGVMIGSPRDWWRPLAPAPDGCFAIFRSDDAYVELVTDPTASRTIWFMHTDDIFVAATTQRAIVLFLQSYSPNPAAHSWMLSDGSLGPGQAWDSRLRSVPANGRLLLDRTSWQLIESKTPVAIAPEELSTAEHRENLTQAIRNVFDGIHLDLSRWPLTLSGGYDSRCILEMLKQRQHLSCVTWGKSSSLDNPDTDAWIARELADRYDVPHRYFSTDLRADSVSEVLDRFLIAGEGRSDHLSAYLDGFAAWKNLFDTGAVGVIRGDINFVPAVQSIAEIQAVTGANLLTDHDRLKHFSKYWPEQARPVAMERRPDETVAMWRDRLGYEYHAATVWAALNELKCAYVDVLNPFLTADFIAAACRLPDPLRDGKRLFMKIVRELCADVPYATRPAIESLPSALTHPVVASHLAEELNSGWALDVLPGEVVERCIGAMVVDKDGCAPSKPRLGFYRSAKALIPKQLRQRVYKKLRPTALHPNVVAFRAYIISRMHRMLKEDALALQVELRQVGT